jgi:hypothetical protein
MWILQGNCCYYGFFASILCNRARVRFLPFLAVELVLVTVCAGNVCVCVVEFVYLCLVVVHPLWKLQILIYTHLHASRRDDKTAIKKC